MLYTNGSDKGEKTMDWTELKRTIKGTGMSINKEKYSDEAGIINADSLINGKYLLVQKGKKNYFLVIAE